MKIDWRPLRRVLMVAGMFFCAIPFFRQDYPWWTKVVALAGGYVYIWLAEQYAKTDGDAT